MSRNQVTALAASCLLLALCEGVVLNGTGQFVVPMTSGSIDVEFHHATESLYLSSANGIWSIEPFTPEVVRRDVATTTTTGCVARVNLTSNSSWGAVSSIVVPEWTENMYFSTVDYHRIYSTGLGGSVDTNSIELVAGDGSTCHSSTYPLTSDTRLLPNERWEGYVQNATTGDDSRFLRPHLLAFRHSTGQLFVADVGAVYEIVGNRVSPFIGNLSAQESCEAPTIPISVEDVTFRNATAFPALEPVMADDLRQCRQKCSFWSKCCVYAQMCSRLSFRSAAVEGMVVLQDRHIVMTDDLLSSLRCLDLGTGLVRFCVGTLVAKGTNCNADCDAATTAVNRPQGITALPDGSLVFFAEYNGGRLRSWNRKTNMLTLEAQLGGVTRLAISPSHIFAVSSLSGHVVAVPFLSAEPVYDPPVRPVTPTAALSATSSLTLPSATTTLDPTHSISVEPTASHEPTPTAGITATPTASQTTVRKPLPPRYLEPSVDTARTAVQATGTAAAAVSLASGPGVAVTASRSSLITTVFQCEFDGFSADTSMSFAEYPLAMHLGTGTFSLQQGAIVFNPALIVCVVVAHVALSRLAFRGTIADALAKGRVVVVAYALCLILSFSTAKSSVMVLRGDDSDAWARTVGAIVLLLLQATPVATIVFLRRQRREWVVVDERAVGSSGDEESSGERSDPGYIDRHATLYTKCFSPKGEWIGVDDEQYPKLAGVIHRDYRHPFALFGCAEYEISLCLGIVAGLPTDTESMCRAVAVSTLLVLACHFIAVVVLRPHIALRLVVAVGVAAGSLCAAALCGCVAQINGPSVELDVAAAWFTVVATSAALLSQMVDVAEIVLYGFQRAATTIGTTDNTTSTSSDDCPGLCPLLVASGGKENGGGTDSEEEAEELEDTDVEVM